MPAVLNFVPLPPPSTPVGFTSGAITKADGCPSSFIEELHVFELPELRFLAVRDRLQSASWDELQQSWRLFTHMKEVDTQCKRLENLAWRVWFSRSNFNSDSFSRPIVCEGRYPLRSVRHISAPSSLAAQTGACLLMSDAYLPLGGVEEEESIMYEDNRTAAAAEKLDCLVADDDFIEGRMRSNDIVGHSDQLVPAVSDLAIAEPILQGWEQSDQIINMGPMDVALISSMTTTPPKNDTESNDNDKSIEDSSLLTHKLRRQASDHELVVERGAVKKAKHAVRKRDSEPSISRNHQTHFKVSAPQHRVHVSHHHHHRSSSTASNSTQKSSQQELEDIQDLELQDQATQENHKTLPHHHIRKQLPHQGPLQRSGAVPRYDRGQASNASGNSSNNNSNNRNRNHIRNKNGNSSNNSSMNGKDTASEARGKQQQQFFHNINTDGNHLRPEGAALPNSENISSSSSYVSETAIEDDAEEMFESEMEETAAVNQSDPRAMNEKNNNNNNHNNNNNNNHNNNNNSNNNKSGKENIVPLRVHPSSRLAPPTAESYIFLKQTPPSRPPIPLMSSLSMLLQRSSNSMTAALATSSTTSTATATTTSSSVSSSYESTPASFLPFTETIVYGSSINSIHSHTDPSDMQITQSSVIGNNGSNNNGRSNGNNRINRSAHSSQSENDNNNNASLLPVRHIGNHPAHHTRSPGRSGGGRRQAMKIESPGWDVPIW